MSQTSLVRKDSRGLFIITGGYTFRPFPNIANEHAASLAPLWTGRNAGLRVPTRDNPTLCKLGDRVKARHVAQTSECIVTLPNGQREMWFGEDSEEAIARRAETLEANKKKAQEIKERLTSHFPTLEITKKCTK